MDFKSAFPCKNATDLNTFRDTFSEFKPVGSLQDSHVQKRARLIESRFLGMCFPLAGIINILGSFSRMNMIVNCWRSLSWTHFFVSFLAGYVCTRMHHVKMEISCRWFILHTCHSNVMENEIQLCFFFITLFLSVNMLARILSFPLDIVLSAMTMANPKAFGSRLAIIANGAPRKVGTYSIMYPFHI